ncbi:hypothetical protein HHL16_04910 [Pseudoflavitalea sp. G-6-1-2]|uniref:lamin tail domain-containing protein n=1 Tax=Pseudoflavitalea sp. G-6-1-2 TaxID=2728841 RepID=UPI00146D1E4E|nr:lamin tail domain-containing protein [Pseudoflavitalea sp. G-6-1-2]NML20199.1 hypothetical protein [Pseudoflavitalea sp. G-6-1-2]
MKERKPSLENTSSHWYKDDGRYPKAHKRVIHFLTGIMMAMLFSIPASANIAVNAISRYQLIITEIMADPSPPKGLPEYEYIELKNISGKALDLIGCKLADENGSANFSKSTILKPDSFLICCSNTAAPYLQRYGKTIGLSNWPSFGNESGIVQLISPQGNIIHAISWHSSWYRNTIKSSGGWSLEMISPFQYCAGQSNWTASNDEAGGTPGRINSVNATAKDELPPALLRTYATDSLHLMAVFDEPVDSASAASPVGFRLDGMQQAPAFCNAVPPLFNEVQIRLPAAMQEQTVYKLIVKELKDCIGNTVGMLNNAKAGRASSAAAGDIVINELLADPPPEGDDYVELFNTSKKIIDLSKLYFSNRNSAQVLINSKPATHFPFLLFPGDYLAICSIPEWLGSKYVLKDRSAVLAVNSLPSLPNENGSLVLSNSQGKIIDEINYDIGWHFSLLQSAEGISLERIDPLQPGTKNNFMSAATTAGGGTPGYINSQYRSLGSIQAQFSLSSKSFSPDLDGIDDVLHIQYNMNTTGVVCTVQVFDLDGNPIRMLAANALTGISGSFSWDGLSESKLALPSGIYIILASWFNSNGATGKWKQGVVLTRRKN